MNTYKKHTGWGWRLLLRANCFAREREPRKTTISRMENTAAMNVVLISTYELGHQPFGLASPAAWLRARGGEVTCLDLSRQRLEGPALTAVSYAALIAFYVPMHTATRLAAQ